MNKNSGLQGLRAIAASLVVLQHGIFFACNAKGVDYKPYLPIGFGWMGVSIFFVISGFVMTLCLPQGRMFMANRIARIYPAFWIAIGVSGLVLPSIGRHWAIDGYSLTLLPATQFNENYQVPYWTLIYEIAFYAIMYGCILLGLSRKAIALTFSVWTAAIVVVCQTNVHPAFATDLGAIFAGWWIFVSPANFMFIAGALYGLVGQDLFRRAPAFFLVSGAAAYCFIAHANIAMPFYFRFALFAASYVSLLDLARRVNVPKVIQRMGDYSYGLYLTQSIFSQVAAYCMARFFPSAALGWFFAATLITPLVVGMMFGAAEFKFHEKVIKGAMRRPIPAPQGS